MNVVLVIFDTLRKDCVGAYGSPPWGEVQTPRLDRFAQEATRFTRFFPESLPTLPARRAIYTGRRVYPFRNADFRLRGDFVGAPGWGPIPEDQDTLAEMLGSGGYRTGLVSDVGHQFKPSKNFTRGFDSWQFLRGQEVDPYRSGPVPSQAEIDRWLAPELQGLKADMGARVGTRVDFVRQCLMNMAGRHAEEDHFNARVMREAAHWLEQNRDAEDFFLTVECFDPHEPWFVPEHYRRMYDDSDRQEQVISLYGSTAELAPELLQRAQANYSGLVTMCDRWFGHLYDTVGNLGRLDDTVFIVMSDHGHALGEGDYMGKRGYPVDPSVLETILLIRHPHGEGAGGQSDLLLQHTDLSAQILDFTGVEPAQPLDGRPFWPAVTAGREAFRDHLTIAWGSAITVVDDGWWMNCKVDGSGPFLYDLSSEQPFAENVADDHPDIVRDRYRLAVADADGPFPEYLLRLAADETDAPGCSALAARS